MAGINIVGVQFRRAGKIYHFDGKDLSLLVGDKVVVETDRGLSLAQVKLLKFADESEVDSSKLKPILRVASKKDLKASQRLTTEFAAQFTKEQIKALDLNMHLIHVEIQFGGNKVLIYFSAPGRVDFRGLVKELASGLKTRVELKQVGARDEAKLAGGIGICGREFCCSSFLREFVPVSIRMAKNQNLALNPSKVSGGCGRLLCCLTYEDQTYKDLRQKLLPKGTKVRLPDGELADVVKGDILNQIMLVENSLGELLNVPISDLQLASPDDQKSQVDADEWADDIDFDELMEGGDQGNQSEDRKEYDNADAKSSAVRSKNKPFLKASNKARRSESEGSSQGENTFGDRKSSRQKRNRRSKKSPSSSTETHRNSPRDHVKDSDKQDANVPKKGEKTLKRGESHRGAKGSEGSDKGSRRRRPRRKDSQAFPKSEKSSDEKRNRQSEKGNGKDGPTHG